MCCVRLVQTRTRLPGRADPARVALNTTWTHATDLVLYGPVSTRDALLAQVAKGVFTMRTPLARLVAAAMLVGAMPVGLVWSEPAGATTLAPLSLEQITDASTWIVRGQVTEVRAEKADDGRIRTHVELAVTTVYKGPSDTDTLEIVQIGGTVDGETLWAELSAPWSVGEDVFVFLGESKSGRLAPVGKYKGKYTLRRAPGERELYGAQVWLDDPSMRYDARFLPHPPASERFYLDELEARVEARVAAGWDGQPIPGASREHLERINQPERRIRR